MSSSVLAKDAAWNFIFANPPPDPATFHPVLQVINIKRVAPMGEQSDRYRLILSDANYYIQGMLATQFNQMIDDGSLQRYSIIKLTNFAINMVHSRRLVIVLGMEVVQSVAEKLGETENIEKVENPIGPANAGAGAATPAPAAPAPAAPARAAPVTRGGFTNAGAARAPAARPPQSKGSDHGPLYPIEALSPYQNKWTIKARVLQKSDVKVWSNARGEGKLFSVTFMDDSGEIRATGFNEAVDSFYDLLQEGKVYFVSKARINIAKKQFSNVNNDYEIMFDGKTEIEPAGDDGAVPQIKYSFVDLSALEQMEKDQTCDILAVVKDVGDLTQIVGKASQKQIAKRELTVVDQSEYSCRLTLWGKTAESFSAGDQPIIAFKGLKVGDFGGRTLSMFSSSTMTVTPDIPEAHSLRGWFDSQDSSRSYKSYSGSLVSGAGAGTGSVSSGLRDTYKTIGEIRDENVGMNDKPDYVTIRATIIYVKKENISYPGCPGEGCQKKVTDEGDQWRCEKCQRSYPAPEYRYIMTMSIVDHTGQMWLTGFNEIGELLLGMNATALQAIKEEDDTQYEAIVNAAANKTFNFACVGKMDTFGEQTRARFSIRQAATLDYKREAKSLIEKIKEYGVVC